MFFIGLTVAKKAEKVKDWHFPGCKKAYFGSKYNLYVERG